MDSKPTVTLIIDDKEVQTTPGSMIIEAADALGVYIPRFCYHSKLSIAANCRMCLVEVEKAPKPLPACATPVSDGMVVRTRSAVAIEAQQGTMEFLLINHPLDCPVCDQGGECPLQDQAMGFGQDYSRYEEEKRVKNSINLGPLVATAMTRCIHCTRCVRFGQEIAGTMELGATGRGEAMTIETYLDGSVDSEVSGNIIDLCPVGALTSKPYRFSARPWELMSHQAISPHDSLGTHINVQTAHQEVKRVVPREHDATNECWISDRDRFAFEGAESDDRLLQPLVRTGEGLKEISWEEAIRLAADAVEFARQDASETLAALMHPLASTEEAFLLQKMMRAVGSSNIDHRLLQQDFADDQLAAPYPSLETPLADISSLDGLLLVGANPRKEIPLLALRIRELVGAGGRVGTLGSSSIDANFDVAVESVVEPVSIVDALCQMICGFEGGAEKLPRGFTPNPEKILSPAEVTEMSDLLKGSASIILGEQALNHPSGAAIRVLASALARVSGCAIGVIAPANSAGAWWAGAVPHRLAGGIDAPRAGANAQTILELQAKTILLYGLEPAIDHCDPGKLSQLLDRAKNVVVFSAFRSSIPDQATLVLPIAPYTEMAGSYLNLNGLLQRSNAALDPRGAARPGWKVLRVLGNFLSLEGFDYQTTDDVLAEIPTPSTPDWHTLESDHWTLGSRPVDKRPSEMTTHFWTPLYATDPVVRRAKSLDQTADAKRGRRCRLHPSDLKKYDLQDGELITLSAAGKKVELPVDADQNVSPGSASIPAGSREATALRSEMYVSILPGQRDG